MSYKTFSALPYYDPYTSAREYKPSLAGDPGLFQQVDNYNRRDNLSLARLTPKLPATADPADPADPATSSVPDYRGFNPQYEADTKSDPQIIGGIAGELIPPALGVANYFTQKNRYKNILKEKLSLIPRLEQFAYTHVDPVRSGLTRAVKDDAMRNINATQAQEGSDAGLNVIAKNVVEGQKSSQRNKLATMDAEVAQRDRVRHGQDISKLQARNIDVSNRNLGKLEAKDKADIDARVKYLSSMGDLNNDAFDALNSGYHNQARDLYAASKVDRANNVKMYESQLASIQSDIDGLDPNSPSYFSDRQQYLTQKARVQKDINTILSEGVPSPGELRAGPVTNLVSRFEKV